MTSTSFGVYFTLIQTVLQLQQKPTNTTAVCSILFLAICCNSHNIHRRSVFVFKSTKRISEQRFHQVSIRDITAWARLRKIWKTSHDNRCPDRDSNRKRPECKPQVSELKTACVVDTGRFEMCDMSTAHSDLTGRTRLTWLWKLCDCGMTPWSLVETYRRFGGSFSMHNHDTSAISNRQPASRIGVVSYTITLTRSVLSVFQQKLVLSVLSHNFLERKSLYFLKQLTVTNCRKLLTGVLALIRTLHILKINL